MKTLRIIAFLFAALSASAQTVTVSANHLGGTTPITGTITFQPVLSDGLTQASTRLASGGGITSRQPLTTAVTAGAFTLSGLTDTYTSQPQNLCYNVTVHAQNGLQVLGPGFTCVQPGSNPASTWCTAGVCNFDLYVPNGIAGVATTTGPPGPAGATGTSGGPAVLVAPWAAANSYASGATALYGSIAYARIVAGTTSTTPNLDSTNWLPLSYISFPQVGLVANNTTSAVVSANTAAIQAVLTAGGTAYLDGAAGSVVTVNGLVGHSHSRIRHAPGVHMQLAANNNVPIFQNYANTQPFVSAGVSVAWTSGTQATVTWPSHGQVTGGWVFLEGLSGQLNDTMIYSSGGTGCTNGTQNVTVGNTVGGTVNGGSNQYFVVGTITVSGGVPTGNVTLLSPQTGYGFQNLPTTGTVATCTGTVTFTIQNPQGLSLSTDSAFLGVFQISSVVNSNSFIIQLRRAPSAAPLGQVFVKQADYDIHFDDAYIDYNGASPQACGNSWSCSAIVMAGVENCSVKDITMTGTVGYGMMFAGVRDCDQDGFKSDAYLVKDCVKVYGPDFDSTYRKIDCQSGDDLFSFQTGEGTGFANNVPPGIFPGGGDIINDHAYNIHGYSEGGAGCAEMYGDNVHLMDAVSIEDAGCKSTSQPFKIGGYARAKLKNITCYEDNGVPCIFLDNGNNFSGPTQPQTQSIIEIDGISSLIENTAGTTAEANAQTLVQLSSGNLGAIYIKNVDFSPRTASDSMVNIYAGTVFDVLDISQFHVVGLVNTVNPLLITGGSASLTNAHTINFHDGFVKYVNGLLNLTVGLPNVKVSNVWAYLGGTNAALIQTSVAANFFIARNFVYQGYMFGFTGSISPNIWSDGTNWTSQTAQRFALTVSGSPLPNIFGGSSDARVDFVTAIPNALAGTSVFNTYTGAGPVGAMFANGTFFEPPNGFRGTTGSIGGSALSASCSTGTATVLGITSTMLSSNLMTATAQALTSNAPDTTGAFRITAKVTAANTVTVSVCGTGTPVASTYAVQVE